MSRNLLALFIAVQLLIAADVSGPVAGLIHDLRTASVRPVLGIPGAATLGPALTEITNAGAVASSPSTQYSLASHGEDHQQLSVIYSDTRPRARLNVIPAVDRIAIAAGGRLAVLYSSRTGLLQVIRGLPDQPAPSAAEAVEGPLTDIAIDDTGRVLFAVTTESRSAVSIGHLPQMRYVGEFVGPVSVGFAAGEAFIAVEETSELFVVSDPDGAREVRLVADVREGINGPTALAGAESSLIVANSGARNLIILTAPFARPEAIVDIPVAPQGLFRLSGSLFSLNQPGSGPLYLFDARRNTLSFVPADLAAEPR